LNGLGKNGYERHERNPKEPFCGNLGVSNLNATVRRKSN
jgi:hypothetical protein